MGGGSGPNGGRLDRHAPRAPHQEELEIEQLGGAIVIRLRPYPDQAVAQPSLERAESLPFQAVDRIPGRVGLRYDVAREPSPPVIVVALAAGEIEPALAAIEDRAAGLEKRLRAAVDPDLDWQPARLARDVGGQGQQLSALVGERRRLLSVDAADVDAFLETERPCARSDERRMARGDALHARPRIAVAVGAGA